MLLDGPVHQALDLGKALAIQRRKCEQNVSADFEGFILLPVRHLRKGIWHHQAAVLFSGWS